MLQAGKEDSRCWDKSTKNVHTNHFSSRALLFRQNCLCMKFLCGAICFQTRQCLLHLWLFTRCSQKAYFPFSFAIAFMTTMVQSSNFSAVKFLWEELNCFASHLVANCKNFYCFEQQLLLPIWGLFCFWVFSGLISQDLVEQNLTKLQQLEKRSWKLRTQYTSSTHAFNFKAQTTKRRVF